MNPPLHIYHRKKFWKQRQYHFRPHASQYTGTHDILHLHGIVLLHVFPTPLDF